MRRRQVRDRIVLLRNRQVKLIASGSGRAQIAGRCRKRGIERHERTTGWTGLRPWPIGVRIVGWDVAEEAIRLEVSWIDPRIHVHGPGQPIAGRWTRRRHRQQRLLVRGRCASLRPIRTVAIRIVGGIGRGAPERHRRPKDRQPLRHVACSDREAVIAVAAQRRIQRHDDSEDVESESRWDARRRCHIVDRHTRNGVHTAKQPGAHLCDADLAVDRTLRHLWSALNKRSELLHRAARTNRRIAHQPGWDLHDHVLDLLLRPRSVRRHAEHDLGLEPGVEVDRGTQRIRMSTGLRERCPALIGGHLTVESEDPKLG